MEFAKFHIQQYCSNHKQTYMRLLTILQRARALSASWAQPLCSTISNMALINRPADWVTNTMSDIRANPSNLSWEMYACSSTFTWNTHITIKQKPYIQHNKGCFQLTTKKLKYVIIKSFITFSISFYVCALILCFSKNNERVRILTLPK